MLYPNREGNLCTVTLGSKVGVVCVLQGGLEAKEQGKEGGDGRGVMATVTMAIKEARTKNSFPNMDHCTPNPIH